LLGKEVCRERFYLDILLAYALGAGSEVGGKPRVQWPGDRQTLIY
jgi:hypothetical protein